MQVVAELKNKKELLQQTKTVRSETATRPPTTKKQGSEVVASHDGDGREDDGPLEEAPSDKKQRGYLISYLDWNPIIWAPLGHENMSRLVRRPDFRMSRLVRRPAFGMSRLVRHPDFRCANMALKFVEIPHFRGVLLIKRDCKVLYSHWIV